jgi:threonine/homoserine/homoserine lactone efflux protein
MAYLPEFLMIALVHLLAVASPGPDFAVVLKQSVKYGRTTALYTSLGIGCGILVHVAYSLIGIGLLIASNQQLFTLLKYVASGYLCYIAWHGLTAKPPQAGSSTEVPTFGAVPVKSVEQQLSKQQAFITGFLVNGLNVKATLFFVSLFSMVINPATPLLIKLSYGLYMAIATAVWFCSLSYFMAHPYILRLLQTRGYWLERVMGAVLVLLAFEILMTELA